MAVRRRCRQVAPSMLSLHAQGGAGSAGLSGSGGRRGPRAACVGHCRCHWVLQSLWGMGKSAPGGRKAATPSVKGLHYRRFPGVPGGSLFAGKAFGSDRLAGFPGMNIGSEFYSWTPNVLCGTQRTPPPPLSAAFLDTRLCSTQVPCCCSCCHRRGQCHSRALAHASCHSLLIPCGAIRIGGTGANRPFSPVMAIERHAQDRILHEAALTAGRARLHCQAAATLYCTALPQIQ